MRKIFLRLSALFLFFSGLSVSAFSNPQSEIIVKTKPYTDWMTFTALIEPINQGTLSAQTSGRISKILVDENDVIPSGALLMEISNTNQSATQDQALAALQIAQSRKVDADKQLNRLSTLISKGGVSRQEFDAAKTESEAADSSVKQARAALIQAKENLGYTQIIAPYSGIVTQKHIAHGEAVAPGQPLISGYDYTKMRITFDIPSQLRASLKEPLYLKVTLPNGKVIALNQSQIFQFADPQSHTFTIRANLPEQNEPIVHDGDLATVQVSFPARPQILIPISAVLRTGELTAVYVKVSNKWILRQVRVGKEIDSQVEITSGLSDGDVIASDPWVIAKNNGGRNE